MSGSGVGGRRVRRTRPRVRGFRPIIYRAYVRELARFLGVGQIEKGVVDVVRGVLESIAEEILLNAHKVTSAARRKRVLVRDVEVALDIMGLRGFLRGSPVREGD